MVCVFVAATVAPGETTIEVGSQFVSGALASKMTKYMCIAVVLYCELPEL